MGPEALRRDPQEAGVENGSFRQVRLEGLMKLWNPRAVERRLECIPGRRGFKLGVRGLVYV